MLMPLVIRNVQNSKKTWATDVQNPEFWPHLVALRGDAAFSGGLAHCGHPDLHTVGATDGVTELGKIQCFTLAKRRVSHGPLMCYIDI